MNLEIDGRTVKLPDFLVVGAARSGTTSLHNYLRQHPQIFMPDLKEPHFFATSGRQPHFTDKRMELIGQPIWKFEDYLSLFSDVDENKIFGEASTYYLYYYDETIRNIKRYIPGWQNLKVIIIIRNPVDRALSQYLLHRLMDIESLEFEDALRKAKERITENWIPGYDYIGFGLYYEQIKTYLNNFSNERIYLFEDLKANAIELVKDIFRFLGVDDSFVPDVGTKHNPSEQPLLQPLYRFLKKPNLVSSVFPPIKLIPLKTRVSMTKKLQRMTIRKEKRVMKEETRMYLKKYYREDILKLQELLGRDLSAWLN